MRTDVSRVALPELVSEALLVELEASKRSKVSKNLSVGVSVPVVVSLLESALIESIQVDELKKRINFDELFSLVSRYSPVIRSSIAAVASMSAFSLLL